MTEQQRSVPPTGAMPQRTGQQQPSNPMQKHQQANRTPQGVPAQANRQPAPSNMQMRRMPAAPSHQHQTMRQAPQRQGQAPMHPNMPPRPQMQRPSNPQPSMASRPVGQHQAPMQRMATPNNPSPQRIPNNTIPPQNNSEQSLSSVQLFLSNPRNLTFILLGAVIFGILLGAIMFGGSSQPVKTGLQNFVKNQDIRHKLPLCGRVVKGQACVLYIMNATRYDQLAENFFDDALKLTEVPKRKIEWANPKYAKHRIPPGAFAEIFIPSLR